MKYRHLLILLLIGQICLAQRAVEYHPNRILLKFADVEMARSIDLESLDCNLPELDKLNQRNGLKSIKVLNPNGRADIMAFEFNHLKEVPATIYAYYETQFFHYVEPDYLGHGAGEKVPNDSDYFKQWGLSNDGSFNQGSPKVGADIDMQKAWDISTGNSETVIAILDTGMKIDHPEFSGRLWSDGTNPSGRDFVNDDSNASDDHGHGTNVASIIVATGDNSVGFAGINWKAQIMPLKILDSNNSGFYSWWAEAIYYAADNGADVLNMSVGGSTYSAVMEDAVNYATEKGAIIVACMMNENSDTPFYPAAYENTIAVGATNTDDTRVRQFPWNLSKGSSYGPHIDICAPGNYIYGLSHQFNSNYDFNWSGTSQAAPHVAGVASLLLGLDPELTLESVRSILTNSAEDQVGSSNEDVSGWDQYYGHGRLNAYEALRSLNSVNIEEVSSDVFAISPNPISKGRDLLITFKVDGEKVVSIFDSTGRIVLMNKTSDSSYSVNSGNLIEGTYYLKVQSQTKPLSSKKFIVK